MALVTRVADVRVRLHNDDWGYETNCYVCEQRNEGGLRIPFFHETEREVVVGEFVLGDTYSGAPTLLHGGVQLAILDEAMAWATIAIAHQWALTASSSAEFHAAVSVDESYRVVAEVVAIDGDRIMTRGRIETEDGSVCTTAQASFVAVGEAVATKIVGAPVKDEHRGYLADGDR